jgi:hypothetical protein
MIKISFFGFLFLTSHLLIDDVFASADEDLSGIYEVTKASLNEKECEESGEPIYYASKFLRVTSNKSSGYNVSVCNGEELDEVDCVGGYQSTQLTEPFQSGWQGYRYSSRKVRSTNNTFQCQLFSSRRRVVSMGKDYVRYERTDWMETLSDFVSECERSMAKIYDQSQSLQCNTHIVIYAKKVKD